MKTIATLVSLAFALTCVPVVFATSVPKELSNIHPYDPLLHSHLVVRGKVLAVTNVQVPMEAWGFEGYHGLLALTRVRFAVAEVLKGNLNLREVTFDVRGQDSSFQAGQELIICARQRRVPSGQVYVAGSQFGVYSSSEARWQRWYSDELPANETWTDKGLREHIRLSSISAMSDSADVVVKGVIVAVGGRSYQAKDGRVGLMTTYQVRGSELLKGKVVSDTIEFNVPSLSAEFVPVWYKKVPNGIAEVGSEWLVFLRNGDQGLYPFGGLNSLLKIEGEKLVYDDALPLSTGTSEALRTIHKKVAREQQ